MNLNYAHLPHWLENNIIFRKLFLVRKIFFTKAKQSHYSQFAEDISITRLFEKSHRGFFVDVGCFHPKKYNNTWKLYKRGWRGINIDIDSIKIEGFNIVRKGDINIACAVSDHEGEITLFTNGFYSLTTSLDSTFTHGKNNYKEKKIRASTLSSIIDNTKYKDRKIDFLSIDAEGHDLKILKSFDIDRYSPRLIAVETHLTTFTQVAKSELYNFLTNKGYTLVGWCGLTLLMANEDLQNQLQQR